MSDAWFTHPTIVFSLFVVHEFFHGYLKSDIDCIGWTLISSKLKILQNPWKLEPTNINKKTQCINTSSIHNLAVLYHFQMLFPVKQTHHSSSTKQVSIHVQCGTRSKFQRQVYFFLLEFQFTTLIAFFHILYFISPNMTRDRHAYFNIDLPPHL